MTMDDQHTRESEYLHEDLHGFEDGLPHSHSVATLVDEDDPSSILDIGPLEGLSMAQILVRRKIIWTLYTYPKISPSMMQSALGPNRPARDWRPVLEHLVQVNIVQRSQQSFLSETGRYRIAIVLSLTSQARDQINESSPHYLVAGAGTNAA